MSADARRPKTGGRTKGTPNKATAKVKAFLDGVFTKAFADPRLEQTLVDAIVTMRIDGRTLETLLKFYAGTPARQVEHTHTGKLTLEQIVAGTVPTADEDEDEDATT